MGNQIHYFYCMNAFIDRLSVAHRECPECPSPSLIQSFFGEILGLLFPDFAPTLLKTPTAVKAKVEELHLHLTKILIKNKHLHTGDGSQIADDFFHQLETVYDAILQDAKAMYAGDPAAKSMTEIIRCYPGFYAIAAYRIAHTLHRSGVGLIPRMITEFAHSKTGIDIHPGAVIGERCCIDHGTGIVIGETTVIGNDVKIYQGVTLGALSVEKADGDKKRHPTIEDHVVMYAGATILGGKTVIGHHSTIGGNVWITKSVPAYSKIYYQAKMYNSSAEEIENYIIREDK